jgi:hypothetical protein
MTSLLNFISGKTPFVSSGGDPKGPKPGSQATALARQLSGFREHDLADVDIPREESGFAIGEIVFPQAPEPVVEAWYVERFLHLCAVAAPATFYANFAGLDDAGRRVMAHQVWGAVNRQNLTEFIQPTRDVATVVVEKQADHTVQRIRFAGSRQ